MSSKIQISSYSGNILYAEIPQSDTAAIKQLINKIAANRKAIKPQRFKEKGRIIFDKANLDKYEIEYGESLFVTMDDCNYYYSPDISKHIDTIVLLSSKRNPSGRYYGIPNWR